jgi:hypothetical protein
MDLRYLSRLSILGIVFYTTRSTTGCAWDLAPCDGAGTDQGDGGLDMRSFKSAQMANVLVGFLMVTLVGCATSYKPASSPQALQERLSQGGSNIEISAASQDVKFQVYPLLDEKVTKTNLGILPADLDMLPIFLKVENVSQNPIKVDLLNSFVVSGEERNPSMMVEDVVGRIKKNDPQAALGMGVVFGLVGGLAGATVGVAVGAIIDSSTVGSRTIEEHYHDKSFKPTLIIPGSSGSGIVFYTLPRDRMASDQATVSFPILNLNTNEATTAEIAIRAKDLIRPWKEKQ